MKKKIGKILGVLMFTVFLYGTVPHEYLHDIFASHLDTVEHSYGKGEYHISAQHTHCAFLGIAFGSFLAADKIYYLFETVNTYQQVANGDN